jgi:PPK2 family polyphosphate:nucleotide phosphotransferase
VSKNDRRWQESPVEHLRVDTGFSLLDFDASSTPGFAGDEKDGEKLMRERGSALADLQEMLYAQGRADIRRSVLLVLQGMDTAGKGGIVRHVMGMVDPQGVENASFGVPTEEERSHHYLWRIEKRLPSAGRIGVFDRSHYEDVLVVRVRNLVPPEVWGARYDEINEWEQQVTASGTTIIKCAMVVSKEEQLNRIEQRLHRPDKYWKYNPGDLDEREHWDAYVEAYQAVFDKTSTATAPWHVIPADNKWYARLAVTEILTQHFESLDLTWPPADFDVEAERARVQDLRKSGG